MPNKFIVIEANDAGGSSTQADLLTKRFKKDKYKTLQLHFPQEDRATGRLIYDTFLFTHNQPGFTKREQALLYIQDFHSRAEDINAFRQQQAKSVVISDRFCTSTFAYQTINMSGKKREDMLSWLLSLAYKAKPKLPKPDKVIFLDTPVEVSLKRLKGKKKDFFENKQKLTAIRNSYLKVAAEQKWKIISSIDEKGNERTKQDLHQEIWDMVK